MTKAYDMKVRGDRLTARLNKLIHPDVSVTLTINFTDEYYDAGVQDDDVEDKLSDLLFALPGASEVCINHQCWVRLDVLAKTYGDIEIISEKMTKEVKKILKSYKAGFRS
jgi:hypothetical protein